MNRRLFLQRLAQIAGGIALAPLVAQIPDAAIEKLPSTLTADECRDWVELTLRDLGEARWTDVCGSLQRHIAMKKLLDARYVKLGYEPIEFSTERTPK